MAKIKHFKLRDGVTLEEIRANHPEIQSSGTYISSDAVAELFKTLHQHITITVALPETESFFRWNDFNYILVLDEDFGQPYGPFYSYWNKNVGSEFPFLERVIGEYNKFLSSLDFLEEVDGNVGDGDTSQSTGLLHAGDQ